jgi:hypothetical protein
MKPFRFPIVATIALLLSGCETTGVHSRIQEKSTVFGNLTDAQKKSIEAGAIEVGYTPDMVYMALGKPSSRETTNAAQGAGEMWTYKNYYPATAATQLTLNNPNQRPQSGQTSSSAPRDGASLASTATSGPQTSLGVADLVADKLYVFFVDSKVSQIKLESEGK